mgnify:CR=1 FL=1
MRPHDKPELIEWFSQMKGIENSACKTYQNVAADPQVTDREVQEAFREIADDEERHTLIVEKIINIIRNNL